MAKNVNNTTTLTELSRHFIKEFSKVTTERTTPAPNLPVTAESILRATELAVKGKLNKLVKISVIDSFLADVGKVSESTYGVLARMTDVPFPLITSGTVKDINSDTKVTQGTLINQLTGKPIGQRYARIGLSELGYYATRHQKGIPMKESVTHKSFIPISLIYPTTCWTLGYRSTMLPMNPGELFSLMVEMIDADNKELPDEVLQRYFKGPDLGENYIVCCKSESLLYLYGSGKGIFTVLPKITIDRAKRLIIFQAPKFNSQPQKLKSYFLSLLQKINKGDETAANNKFQSFDYYDVGLNGGEFYFKDVVFNTQNDLEILYELWSHKEVKETVHITNTTLLKNRNKKDIKPIKDVLWEHIYYEEEMVRKEYEQKLLDLEKELFFAKLLEKVTRPEVAKVIKSLILDTDRVQKMKDIFGVSVNTDLKINNLPEGLTDNELSIIWNQSEPVKVNGRTINLLSILPYRDKYKELWIPITAQIDEIKDILANRYKIREIIRRDLVDLINSGKYNRKSDAKFLKYKEEKIEFDDSISFQPLIYNRVYDIHRLPVTVICTEKSLIKNYGKNLNVLSYNRQTNGDLKYMINCMNDEQLIVKFNDNTQSYIDVKTLNHITNTNGKQLITGVVPFSNNPKLILTHILDRESGAICNSRIRIIENNVFPHFDDTEYVAGYIELTPDTEAVDLLLSRCMGLSIDNHNSKGVIRIDVSTIYPKGIHDVPSHFGIIVDICGVKASDGLFVIKPKVYNYIENPPRVNKYINVDHENLPDDIYPTFSKNLEFYYRNFYIDDLQSCGIIGNQDYRKPKKYITNEKCIKHILDKPSVKLKSLLNKDILTNPEAYKFMLPLKVYSTEHYDKFKICDLQNNTWSLVDNSLGMPIIKPTTNEDIMLCNTFAEKVFTNKVGKKDKLPKVEIKAREELARVNYQEMGEYKDKYKN